MTSRCGIFTIAPLPTMVAGIFENADNRIRHLLACRARDGYSILVERYSEEEAHRFL